MESIKKYSIKYSIGIVIFIVFSLGKVCWGDFQEMEVGLAETDYGSLSWGDYDNDGDLDLAVTGYTNEGRASKIYRNDGGSFVDINAGLTGTWLGSLAWGDYDHDGDLDLALAGTITEPTEFVSKIYRNDGGSFVDINAGLTGVGSCSLAWGDYDNDGDLDLALAGTTGPTRISKIYRNDGGSFVDINAGLTGVFYCSLAWGDYDNDGDLDLALAGVYTAYVSKIYRNDGGSFVDINAGITGLCYCSLAWGDYDNDGDLDLALSGFTGSSQASKIYRNDGGSFVDINAGLTGVYYCSLAWGDYDNDGDLDLALAGDTDSGQMSKIYRNDGGSFVDIDAGLIGVRTCTLAWGDYDNDGDLDLVFAGHTDSGDMSKIYRNNGGILNTSPAPPTSGFGFTYTSSINSLELRWGYGSDAQTTSQKGLYYTVRVANETPINDNNAKIVSWQPASPLLGNYFHGFIADGQAGVKLAGLPANTQYYWQVRAIDSGLQNGNWSAEQTANTMLETTISAIINDPVSYNFGNLGINISTVTADSFVCINNGTVIEKYSLRLSTTGAGPVNWDSGTANAKDIFVLKAGFHSSRPQPLDFGAEDIVNKTNTLSGDAIYSIDGTQKGINVGINSLRKLWIMLQTPTDTSTISEQKIRIYLTAEEQ